MQNDYYTPDIEDIRVGYELEYRMKETAFISQLKDGKRLKATSSVWKPYRMTLDDFGEGISGMGDSEHNLSAYVNEFRTPYLTKEQIEDEGWIIDIDEPGLSFVKGKWDLIYYPLRNIIHLDTEDKTASGYYGSCPSINEFRYICKLLNIK